MGKPLQSHKGQISSIAFSSDSKYVASRDQVSVKAWILEGELIKEQSFADGQYDISIEGHKVTLEVELEALSQDGRYIVKVEGDNKNWIKVWDTTIQSSDEEHELLHSFRGCENSLIAIGFSCDTRYIVGICSDQVLRYWTLQDEFHKVFESLREISPVTFSLGEKGLISGNIARYLLTQGCILIQNPECEKLFRLENPSALRSVAISPDGKYSVSSDSVPHIWNIDGEVISSLQGHYQSVESVAFTSDSQLVISGGFDKTIRLWKLTGENIKTIDLGVEPFRLDDFWSVWSIKMVAYDSNTQCIVAGVSNEEYDFSGYIKIINLKGEPVSQPFGDNWRFALSPNGKYVATVDKSNTIQLWDIKGNRLGSPFYGHDKRITSLAFSPDSHLIASGSNDTLVNLWDVDGNLISTFRGHQQGSISVAFSSDGYYVASSSSDNTVRLWSISWHAYLKSSCDLLRYHPVFTNPESIEDIEQRKIAIAACETCRKYVWSKEDPSV